MDILVVGGGLCGTLVALALRQRQLGVTIVTGSDHPQPIPTATHYSYGGIPSWIGVGDNGRMLSGQGLAGWLQLQEQYGDLGLRPAALMLYWSAADNNAAVEAAVEVLMASLPAEIAPEHCSHTDFYEGDLKNLELTCAGAIRLPYGRIDGHRYQQAMATVLSHQKVTCSPSAVAQLEVRHGQCIGARLADGTILKSDGVVLATGAAMASLLPLPKASQHFPYSWASVLPLRQPKPHPDVILQPLLGGREQMEHQGREDLVVDPGLAPWNGGVLFGQVTSTEHQSKLTKSPENPTTMSLPGPWQPSVAEGYLHHALAELAPGLVVASQQQQATVRHCPVSYSPDGRPWIGPCPGIENLWLFGGFRGGFALAPVLAPLLADAIAHSSSLDAKLGVDPARLLDQTRIMDKGS